MPTKYFRLMSSFLLVLATASLICAADHPLPDPAGGITAWGKPEKGLQAGIRCPKGKQSISPKQEQVTLEIVIRNVSDQPIRFKYLHGVRYMGRNEESTVEVSGIYSGKGHAWTANIQPSEEMLLGRLNISHVRPKAPGSSDSLRCDLRPGKYQVGYDNVTMPVGEVARDRKLGTGYLDIEVQDSKKVP